MSPTSVRTWLRPRVAAFCQKVLAALTAPYSNRYMPALTRRTRHRPGQSSPRRDR